MKGLRSRVQWEWFWGSPVSFPSVFRRAVFRSAPPQIFRVQGFVFRVQGAGSGFRVCNVEFGAWGIRLRVYMLGLGVNDLGCRV